ncbi:hypothetical protein BX600DRAFT_468187 [Xylariales sp. PMI_506]|nr:hypothetical protein BX600DRAFT_468187 [Xylariales sp. PMI_506]
MAPFKVILIGGGPAGLMQAIALSKANIDYVLVEKRDSITLDVGAGLFTWPQAQRLFHQLGFLERADDASFEISKLYEYDSNGDKIRANHVFEHNQEDHGYVPRGFGRARMIEVLYDQIPNPEKHIKTGKSLTGLETTESGVTAYFSDGSSEQGSILIGADGVWSKTRQLLAKAAPADSGIEVMPYTVKYTGFFGCTAEPLPALPLGVFGIQRVPADRRLAFQFFSSPTETFFIGYHRRDTETKEPEFYSDADADAFLEPLGDLPVGHGTKVRDFWEGRRVGGMTQMHQGVAKKWHSGRVVLLGDSAHKVTPNLGIGAILAFESAASLTNHLRALLRSSPEPDAAAVEAAFAAFQAERFARVTAVVARSESDLDMILYHSKVTRFIWAYVVPAMDALGYVRKRVRRTVSTAPVLDFVNFDQHPGLVPWKTGPVSQNPAAAVASPAKSSVLGTGSRWVVGAATLAALVAITLRNNLF